MKDRFRIKEFDIGNEVQELYWIAGTTFNADSDCFIRPVLRGVDSGNFTMTQPPIGLLPMLTLGRLYHRGYLLERSMTGLLDTIVIPDLADGIEVTSADLPANLYSFDDRKVGAQKLLRYRIDGINLYLPTIELIRYLFLHNKTLANALMRADALHTYFNPQQPGFQEEMRIDFAAEMPVASITLDFVREFAWLALDVEGRSAWDSVRTMSLGKQYLTLDPPSIKQALIEYRGLFDGNSVLVLALSSLTGRMLPCKKIIASHPALKRVKWNLKLDQPDGEGQGDSNDDSSKDPIEVVEYDYDINDGGSGSTSQRSQKAFDIALKRSSFENVVEVERTVIREFRDRPSDSGKKGKDEKTVIKKTLNVSVGNVSNHGEVSPIELRLLVPGRPEDSGDLYLLANVVKYMVGLLPDADISMALCQLKSGKQFSMMDRHPRLAMVTTIYAKDIPPIILLDTDHSDETALSLLAVKFHARRPFNELEPVIQQILDGLIDNNGHWDTSLETKLQETCRFERFPRLMTPREEDQETNRSAVRAVKLAARLGLMKFR